MTLLDVKMFSLPCVESEIGIDEPHGSLPTQDIEQFDAVLPEIEKEICTFCSRFPFFPLAYS